MLTPFLPLWTGPVSAAGTLKITFLGVAGDATLFEGPCGKLGLIDAPGDVKSVERIKDAVGGNKLEWIEVSHYDADHMGGVAKLIRAPDDLLARGGHVYDRGPTTLPQPKPDAAPATKAKEEAKIAAYNAYQGSVKALGSGVRETLSTDRPFELCPDDPPVTFHVVYVGTDPATVGGKPVRYENDKSACVRVTYVNFAMATCGDIGGKEAQGGLDVEAHVLNEHQLQPVDVATVNHHGSANSMEDAWIKELDPSAWVLSAGTNARQRKGQEQTVARLSELAPRAALFSTRAPGTASGLQGIVLTTDGVAGFSVSSGSGGPECFPLHDASTCPSARPSSPVSPAAGGPGPGGSMAAIAIRLAILAAAGLAALLRIRTIGDRPTVLQQEVIRNGLSADFMRTSAGKSLKRAFDAKNPHARLAAETYARNPLLACQSDFVMTGQVKPHQVAARGFHVGPPRLTDQRTRETGLDPSCIKCRRRRLRRVLTWFKAWILPVLTAKRLVADRPSLAWGLRLMTAGAVGSGLGFAAYAGRGARDAWATEIPFAISLLVFSAVGFWMLCQSLESYSLAWLITWAAAIGGLVYATDYANIALLTAHAWPHGRWVAWAGDLIFFPGAIVFLNAFIGLLPDGHWKRRWQLRILLTSGPAASLILLANAFEPRLASFRRFAGPLAGHLPSGAVGVLSWIGRVLLILSLLFALLSVLEKAAEPSKRDRVRWYGWGALLGCVALVPAVLFGANVLTKVLGASVALAIPVAAVPATRGAAWAHERYRRLARAGLIATAASVAHEGLTAHFAEQWGGESSFLYLVTLATAAIFEPLAAAVHRALSYLAERGDLPSERLEEAASELATAKKRIEDVRAMLDDWGPEPPGPGTDGSGPSDDEVKRMEELLEGVRELADAIQRLLEGYASKAPHPPIDGPDRAAGPQGDPSKPAAPRQE